MCAIASTSCERRYLLWLDPNQRPTSPTTRPSLPTQRHCVPMPEVPSGGPVRDDDVMSERCDYCKDPTDIWSAPHEQWNAATEAVKSSTTHRGMILCVECYMDLYCRMVGPARFVVTAEALPRDSAPGA